MRSSRRRCPGSTRTSYPGAGDPQDARDAGPTRGRRASRCRSRGPVHRRTPHGRPGPARRPPCQVPAHHAQRAARAVPGRPRQKAFQRVQAERAVGRRHSPASGRYPLLCTHLLRVGLRRFRHRCLLAANRGLADLHEPVHRPGRRRPSDGRLAAETSGGRPDGPGAPPATEGCSTGPSATGRPCPRPRQSPRWGRRATPFGFALAEALNSLYKAELIRNQGPWEDIDAARARHRRVGPLVRAPFALTPPSGCEPLPSTKPPGHPTATATNNHNRQPPAPDKPATTKPGA